MTGDRSTIAEQVVTAAGESCVSCTQDSSDNCQLQHAADNRQPATCDRCNQAMQLTE